MERTMTTNEIFSAIAAGDLERVRQAIAADPSAAAARDDVGVSAITRAQYLQRPEIVAELAGAGA